MFQLLHRWSCFTPLIISYACRGVHESFAMLHMSSESWSSAYDEFYAAFKCYSDAGNSAARRSLK